MKALVAENVNKRFLRTHALRDFSVSIDQGKIIGLLGPNGSGKTTFMRIAAGLLQPTSGTLEIGQKQMKDSAKNEIAYMPTESHLYSWMTVKEIINFYETFFPGFDSNLVTATIQELKIEMSQRIKALSTGQRGRLKVALTLGRQAKVYMLDEPLNGIDPISRDMILNLIAGQVKPDSTIIVSSHLVHEFEHIVDDAIFLREGALALQGSVDALREEHNMSLHDLYKEVYQNA